MTNLGQFTDPRLVAIYETVNPYDPGTQPDFCFQLAAEIDAQVIIDIGCGTGLITREFARRGYEVIGVDPHALMINVAKTRPYGDQVRWYVGDASQLGAVEADLAIMTGHVAQFFLTDDAWHANLTALHTALKPGGHLAFESRRPEAREWAHWTRERSLSFEDPQAGRIEIWTEFQDMHDGVVSSTDHYLFHATGEELVSPGRLRFRSEEELRRSLNDAGFEIETVYGDWDRRPAGSATRELIVVAIRQGI